MSAWLPRRQWAVVGALAATCAAVVVALFAAAFISEAGRGATAGSHTPTGQPGAP